MPASLAVSCSSMQCKNSNLMVGNYTAQQSSAGCNVTSCNYGGFVNGSIVTTYVILFNSSFHMCFEVFILINFYSAGCLHLFNLAVQVNSPSMLYICELKAHKKNVLFQDFEYECIHVVLYTFSRQVSLPFSYYLHTHTCAFANDVVGAKVISNGVLDWFIYN